MIEHPTPSPTEHTNRVPAPAGQADVRIRLECQTPGQFLDRHAGDVSRGGIFVRTGRVLAVGTTVRLDLRLGDGSPFIAGEGTVFWTREPDPARAETECGMGIRFSRLTADSQQMLSFLLAEKTERERIDDRGGFDQSERTIVASDADLRAITEDDRNQRSSRHVVLARRAPAPAPAPAPVVEAPREIALAPAPAIPIPLPIPAPSPRPSRKLGIGVAVGGVMVIAAWFALAAKPTTASPRHRATGAVPSGSAPR
jgi:uncharacterized protein (TIGR02266 family)